MYFFRFRRGVPIVYQFEAENYRTKAIILYSDGFVFFTYINNIEYKLPENIIIEMEALLPNIDSAINIRAIFA